MLRLLIACLTISLACSYTLFNEYDKLGINIGFRAKILEQLKNQTITTFPKSEFEVNKGPIKSVALKKVYSGNVFNWIASLDVVKATLYNSKVQVEVKRDRFLFGETSDIINVNFEYITITFDFTRTNKKIIKNIQIIVDNLKTDSKLIPDKVLDYFGTSHLNELFNSPEIIGKIGDAITTNIFATRQFAISEKDMINLSTTKRLSLGKDKTIKQNYNRDTMIFMPFDGSVYDKNETQRNVSAHFTNSFDLGESVNDINLIVSEYTVNQVTSSKFKESGGINSKWDGKGFFVNLSSGDAVPKITILSSAVKADIKMKTEVGYRGFKKSVDLDIIISIVPKLLENNKIEFEVTNIEFNNNVITSLIKIPFINISGLIVEVVNSALKSAIKVPPIDVTELSAKVTQGRIKLSNLKLNLMDGNVDIGADLIK